MSEFGGGYALDGRIVSAERQKEIDDAFADACLFAFLVNVLVSWEVEQDLSISVVFVLRLRHLRFERGVNNEDGADAHLFECCLHLCILINIQIN
jgi:hypothetical protein